MLRTLVVFIAMLAAHVIPASAQQVRVSGTIASVDLAARQLVMKMDAGPELTVRLNRSNIALNPGQRIVVHGRISRDEKAVEAVEIASLDKNCVKSDAPIHAALSVQRQKNGCLDGSAPVTD